MEINKQIRSRVTLTGVIIASVMLLLLVRLYYIQIIAADDIAAAAERQFLTKVKEPPARGDIICYRNGHVVYLASTIYMPTLSANPRAIEDRPKMAADLARILGRDRAEILELLNKTEQPDGGPNYHVKIAERLTEQQVRRVEALKCPALTFSDQPVRVYPRGRFLASVLGFVGNDDDGFQNRGLEGLERKYDEMLRGVSGTVYYNSDAARNKISILEEKTVASKKGRTIILTIDPDIQEFVEAALDEVVRKWRPESATAIVMDPNTGDILALANRPDFDPGNYEEAEPDEYRNRAVTDTYEPGSTFKAVTASSVLEEGLATPETSFKCYGLVEGRAIGGDKSSGWLTVREILVRSSNRGAARMGLLLNSAGRQRQWVLNFGFGRPTGIDFPGERSGTVTPANRWSKFTAGSVGFGHEISLTPLQLARAYCVIANGGMLVRPRLVRAIIDADGNRADLPREEGQRILSEEVAAAMRSILRDVVKEGTGRRAQVPGYEIGGKTGTAEKVVNGVYSPSQNFATFVGMGPIDKPRLCVLISVNGPHGGSFASEVAAPGVGEIFRRSLRLFDTVEKQERENKH